MVTHTHNMDCFSTAHQHNPCFQFVRILSHRITLQHY